MKKKKIEHFAKKANVTDGDILINFIHEYNKNNLKKSFEILFPYLKQNINIRITRLFDYSREYLSKEDREDITYNILLHFYEMILNKKINTTNYKTLFPFLKKTIHGKILNEFKKLYSIDGNKIIYLSPEKFSAKYNNLTYNDNLTKWIILKIDFEDIKCKHKSSIKKIFKFLHSVGNEKISIERRRRIYRAIRKKIVDNYFKKGIIKEVHFF